MLEQLKQELQGFFAKDKSGHDFSHAERVLKLAQTLQKSEGGNEQVISVAALVHDMYRPWEKETGKSHFGPEALAMMNTFLQPFVSEEIIQGVLAVVAKHDIYDWSEKQEKSIELKVLQDADNLDAIGAIGIGRTFMFGGAYGLPMYIPGEDLDFNDDFVEDPNHQTSTIAHFYEKLLKLKENMNTDMGRQLAEHRTKFMEVFLEEFFKEWEGKR